MSFLGFGKKKGEISISPEEKVHKEAEEIRLKKSQAALFETKEAKRLRKLKEEREKGERAEQKYAAGAGLRTLKKHKEEETTALRTAEAQRRKAEADIQYEKRRSGWKPLGERLGGAISSLGAGTSRSVSETLSKKGGYSRQVTTKTKRVPRVRPRSRSVVSDSGLSHLRQLTSPTSMPRSRSSRPTSVGFGSSLHPVGGLGHLRGGVPSIKSNRPTTKRKKTSVMPVSRLRLF